MTKKDQRKAGNPSVERSRDEVYGMRVEDIIADAGQKPKPPAKSKTPPEPEPAWPSLEDLEKQGPQARSRKRAKP